MSGATACSDADAAGTCTASITTRSVERKGTASNTLMSCKYMIDVRIEARQDGDAVQAASSIEPRPTTLPIAARARIA